MQEIKLFQDKIDAAIKKLDVKLVIKDVTSTNIFNFCCSDLNDGYEKSADFKGKTEKIKKELPTIYWFEITSACPPNLREEIDRLRQGGKFKLPPTISKATSHDILYVGKVIKGFQGRVLQHLGYKSPGTWSLQLKHWTKDFNPSLNLKLNYIQLDKEINSTTLALLEQRVAEELKPILGKHSL